MDIISKCSFMIIVLSALFFFRCDNYKDVSSYGVDDLELHLKLDSIEWPKEYVIDGDKLYLTGMYSTGPWSLHSKLFAIDLKTMKLDWDLVFNQEQTNQFTNLSLINEKLVLTGVSGEHYRPEGHTEVVKKLSPTIVIIDKKGTLLNQKKMEIYDADDRISHSSDVVMINGTYYMTYHKDHSKGKDHPSLDLNEKKLIERADILYSLKMLRLTDDLELDKKLIICHHNLNDHFINTINDKLVITGIYSNAIKIYSINETDLTVEDVLIPNKSRSAKSISYESDGTLKIISTDETSFGSDIIQFSQINFDGEKAVLDHYCELPKNVFHYELDINQLEDGYLAEEYVKLSEEKNRILTITRNNSCKPIELIKFNNVHRFDKIYFPHNANKTIVQCRESGRTLNFYKLKKDASR